MISYDNQQQNNQSLLYYMIFVPINNNTMTNLTNNNPISMISEPIIPDLSYNNTIPIIIAPITHEPMIFVPINNNNTMTNLTNNNSISMTHEPMITDIIPYNTIPIITDLTNNNPISMTSELMTPEQMIIEPMTSEPMIIEPITHEPMIIDFTNDDNMSIVTDIALEHYNKLSYEEILYLDINKYNINFIIKEMNKYVPFIINTKKGCILLQKILEKTNEYTITNDIIEKLLGTVFESSKSKYGNYVIQTVIKLYNTIDINFIPKELLNNGLDIATHPIGCRIICRLIEYYYYSEYTLDLLDEIFNDDENIKYLTDHKYGQYIIQTIISYKANSLYAYKIVNVLVNNILFYSNKKNSGRIIELIILYYNGENKEYIINILSEPSNLKKLLMTKCGCYVANKVIEYVKNKIIF